MAKKKSTKKAAFKICRKYAGDGSLADIEDLNPTKKKACCLRKSTTKKPPRRGKS